jgi:hypothetical protein
VREYFVSYFFEGKRGVTGYGSITINRVGLIRNHIDLEGIRQYIKQKNKFKEVTIISWRRYEQPEALIGQGGVR